MRVAIMQPTYLPWLGWFDLMDQVDTFVLLDDVQFAGRSWQQRNRIKGARGLQWLTVPVQGHGRHATRLADVGVADPGFAAKHEATIAHAYARAGAFRALAPRVTATYAACARATRLVDVNRGTIDLLRDCLGVTTPLVAASALAVGGERGEHLARLCEALGATAYVTPPGAVPYLREDRAHFAARGLPILVHHYAHPAYAQLHPPFASHASALDAVLNLGDAAGAVLRAGRRAPVPLDDYTAADPDPCEAA